MLILYSDKTTSFSTLGIGVLRDFKSDPLITEELNGTYTLEFSYAKNGYLVDYIVEGAIVKANNQPFRIWTIKKDMDAIEILAKHIFFDLSTNFLEDVAPTNLKSQEALEWILEKAQVESNFNVSGDCSIVTSARYVRKNITDAIYNEDNAILKRFGGEIELNGYNVTVHAKRGKKANFSIRYRKNLTGIEFNLDFSTVATRIMPQGANELLLDEKYVDSPLINNYFTPIYKKIDFSNVAVDENTTLEEAQDLLREEVNKLFAAGLDKPEISIKVDFVELSKCIEYKDYSNLESCGLGDTVKAIIPELNLDLETRIVKTVYNCALERYTTLELGNIKTDFVSNQSKVINEINNVVSNVNPESILSKAKEEATEIINHPFNGNIYIDKNTGVLYLMDTNDISTAKNIWKWSLGGLGFSENGVNGPYETAITQDGSIVADFITSGKINTSLIEGYEQLLLQVENNEEDIAQLSIATDGIKSTTSSIQKDLETNYYDIEKVNELIQNAESGLTNTFLRAGGNNLLRNTAPYFMESENKAEYWEGNVKRMKESNSVSGYALLLQNGTITQTINLSPNQYAIKFKYKKLTVAGTCTVQYNGRTIELAEEEGVIETTGTVNSGQFEFKVTCDTNDSFEIYDLMLNVGQVAMPWTQNANESTSDTVNISKGITVSSNTSNTLSTMNDDGFKVKNATTNEEVMVATDDGGKFKNIEANRSSIAGVLMQKIKNQTWISGV